MKLAAARREPIVTYYAQSDWIDENLAPHVLDDLGQDDQGQDDQGQDDKAKTISSAIDANLIRAPTPSPSESNLL